MTRAERPIRPAGLRERKKWQTRRELLAIAQQLFTENEFAEVTVEQIAELANVSQKTFFNYFQNKSQFLSAYMRDWLLGIGFWSFEDAPIVDCHSAIIPTDTGEQLEWIIEHRRMLKMAMQQTDFFDFVYSLDEHSSTFDAELHTAIRKPRQERVAQAQAQGLVRDDMPTAQVCQLYDAVRVDVVRRWLFLRDEDATPALLREWFDTQVDAMVKGIEPR